MNSIIAGVFNLSGPDLLVILFFVLLMFGAKKLPELARAMGTALKEFSAARTEIERELSQADTSQRAEPHSANAQKVDSRPPGRQD
jgi:sec-independent protein translocase protein TatA